MNIVTAGFSATLKALKTAANNAIEMAIQMEKWNSIDWNKGNEMNDGTHNTKCKWKDGKFKPCLNTTGFFDIRKNIVGILKDGGFYGDGFVKYCPSCGADIRKPEPSVIIRKSGETWVARYDGIDYLYIGENNNPSFDINYVIPVNMTYWEPISEIEITDKIAKLRPMVMCTWLKNESIDKLYGIDREDVIVNSDTGYIGNYRLATVSDLEEQA